MTRSTKHHTKNGDLVRVAFNAKRSDCVTDPPIIPARLSGPLRVTGVWAKGVRVGGDSVNHGQWHRSWLRVHR